MRSKSRFIAEGAVIAALYIILTIATSAFGFSSGVIQFRLSEVLLVLPCFSGAAIPGLFIGCLISNLISGAVIFDIIFGSLATLLGAIGTRLVWRALKKSPFILRHAVSSAPAVLSNVIIVPLVLVFAYNVQTAYPLILLSVFISEFLAVTVLGFFVSKAVSKHPEIFSGN